MENENKSQIENLCQRAKSQNRLQHSFFLDPMRQIEAMAIAKTHDILAVLWGGYPESERKMLFLLPDYMKEEEIQQTNVLSALSLHVSGSGLSHRDYLGGILGTGIKRPWIGDILVGEKQALVYAETKMADYLQTSLNKIGRMSVSIDTASSDDWTAYENDGEQVQCSVSALRLDAVVAAVFQTSRGNVQEWIQSGDVSLNWTPCLQSSKTLHVEDTISIRRKGRAVIEKVGGQSRKGRLFIHVVRFRRK